MGKGWFPLSTGVSKTKFTQKKEQLQNISSLIIVKIGATVEEILPKHVCTENTNFHNLTFSEKKTVIFYRTPLYTHMIVTGLTA